MPVDEHCDAVLYVPRADCQRTALCDHRRDTLLDGDRPVRRWRTEYVGAQRDDVAVGNLDVGRRRPDLGRNRRCLSRHRCLVGGSLTRYGRHSGRRQQREDAAGAHLQQGPTAGTNGATHAVLPRVRQTASVAAQSRTANLPDGAINRRPAVRGDIVLVLA